MLEGEERGGHGCTVGVESRGAGGERGEEGDAGIGRCEESLAGGERKAERLGKGVLGGWRAYEEIFEGQRFQLAMRGGMPLFLWLWGNILYYLFRTYTHNLPIETTKDIVAVDIYFVQAILLE